MEEPHEARLSEEEESPAPALSPGKESHGARLSEQEKSLAPTLSPWLQLMLAEIARKQEELERAHAEAARRELEFAAEPGGPAGSEARAQCEPDAHAPPH